MTASPASHLPAAVHSHEPVPCFAAHLGRSVLRLRPARAVGVILSVSDVLRLTEAWSFRSRFLPRLERLACQGRPLAFGSLIPLACQGLRFFAFAYRVPAYLHRRALPVDEQSNTGRRACASPKLGRFIQRSAA